MNCFQKEDVLAMYCTWVLQQDSVRRWSCKQTYILSDLDVKRALNP